MTTVIHSCLLKKIYQSQKRQLQVHPQIMLIRKVRFENCASFSHCISEINNTQVDDVKYIDVAMALYNLMEYNDIYSKTFASLWQYYIDEAA